ncbi:MAG TPA: helix-turn-helix transcriptional regulator [Candidatus Binataceae bacterium]|jgi:transcriptional regulator with XRE-family HTH domain|nr:helix-turn-helix transcriptional regulator [Candidatus Binataceae bacterium]
MPKAIQRTFGAVIRERRRQLDLTQDEVGKRIKTSTPYIGHLEAGKRHPSEKVVARLSEVLGLESRELFFLANPRARGLLSSSNSGPRRSAWDEFRRDERIRRAHNISADEMDVLERIAAMGEARAARDFIYILNAIRQALGR